MRKLYRSIARARMEKAGIQHINKRPITLTGLRSRSYFTENWRRWCLSKTPMTGRRV